MPYLDTLSVREARDLYYRDNDFGADGGDSLSWVKLKLGPIPLAIPNTDGRRRAVKYHDLHHLVTGYRTDWVGEFEISAWEIGSGCKREAFAWFINSQGMVGGLFLCPRRSLRAFVRGRSTQNLYGLELEPLLEETVADLRRRMGTDASIPEPSAAQVVGWLAWSLLWLTPLLMLAVGMVWFFC